MADSDLANNEFLNSPVNNLKNQLDFNTQLNDIRTMLHIESSIFRKAIEINTEIELIDKQLIALLTGKSSSKKAALDHKILEPSLKKTTKSLGNTSALKKKRKKRKSSKELLSTTSEVTTVTNLLAPYTEPKLLEVSTPTLEYSLPVSSSSSPVEVSYESPNILLPEGQKLL